MLASSNILAEEVLIAVMTFYWQSQSVFKQFAVGACILNDDSDSCNKENVHWGNLD